MDPGDRGVLPDSWRDWLRRTCRYGKYLRPGSEDRDVRIFRQRKNGGRLCGTIETEENVLGKTLKLHGDAAPEAAKWCVLK